MRTSTIFSATVLLAAASVQAVDTTGLPSCGSKCFDTALSSSSNCSSTDATCICDDYNLGYAYGVCLTKSCAYADQSSSQTWFINYCVAAIYDASGYTASSTFDFSSYLSSLTATATGTARATATGAARSSATTTAGSYGSGSTSTSSSSSYYPSSKSGLSNGAKIGIGIGAALVVLGAIAAIVTLLCIRRQKKRKAQQTTLPYQTPPQPPVAAAAVAGEKPGAQAVVQPVAGADFYGTAAKPGTYPPGVGQPGFNPHAQTGSISPAPPYNPNYNGIPQPTAAEMPGAPVPQGWAPPQNQGGYIPTGSPVPGQGYAPPPQQGGYNPTGSPAPGQPYAPPPQQQVYEAPGTLAAAPNTVGVQGHAAELPGR